jgi:glycosyltransferase involved in cell wall biosynthesis
MQDFIKAPPKVSICIPTYKQVEFLKRTLQSIAIQTFSNYEIIICDDSPDDSVYDLINTFGFNGRLKYYKNEKNLGSPENWNETIKYATGEYIKMLHHDDFFTDEFSLAKFVTLLNSNPSAHFGFSSSIGWDTEVNHKYLYKPKRSLIDNMVKDPNVLYLGNLIGAPSATIFRRTLSQRFDNNLKWLVDTDFYIRAIKESIMVAYIPEPLISIARGIENQMTEKCLSDKNTIVKENLYLFEKLNDQRIKFKLFTMALFIKYQVSEEDLKNMNFSNATFKKLLKQSKNHFVELLYKFKFFKLFYILPIN